MLDHPEQRYRRPENIPRTEAKHVETGAEARQGSLGHPVFYVLVAGLILAGLFLLGTQIWSTTEPLPEEGAVSTPVEPAPAPAPPLGEAPVAPPPADVAPPPADVAPPPAEAVPPPAGAVPPPAAPAPVPAPAGN
jgi:hypothetical protein